MMKRTLKRLRMLMLQNQRGVTGLETAVLLTAMTVASSVFGLAYMRTSMSASSEIQTSVTSLLDGGEASLFAVPPAFSEDPEQQSPLDPILSQFKNAARSASSVEQSQGDRFDGEDLRALLAEYAELGVPFSITVMPGGGVTVTVDQGAGHPAPTEGAIGN